MWVLRKVPLVGIVALRKESVDRNSITRTRIVTGCVVALRKESVDRNTSIDNLTQGVFKSLSARRAWIEMRDVSLDYKEVLVALRKESVDRNDVLAVSAALQLMSLSARRAWIEIFLLYH